jgi:hypothetical protein
MSRQFTISFVPFDTQRPERVNQAVSINNELYATNPTWHQIQQRLTLARNIPTGAFGIVNLSLLNTWHNANASSIYQTYIPSSYNYIFDATGTLISTSINDGGFDMYDSGNFITISTTRGTSNVFYRQSNDYGRISTVEAQNFGYMVTARNVWPQVSLSFLQNGSVRWLITGGIGTDGGGILSNVSSTYTTSKGYTGRFWANQGFGTTDPTICYTWFTIESTSWNTLISSSNNNLAATAAPPDPMNQSFSITGCNFMFGVFLLSARRVTASPNGFFISTTFITNFLSNYVENADIQFT